jgi:hypothetical protein
MGAGLAFGMAADDVIPSAVRTLRRSRSRSPFIPACDWTALPGGK